MKSIRRLAARVVLVSIFAAAFFLSALPSCGTVPAPVVTKVEHAVDCNAKTVVSQLPVLIPLVATDLLSQNYVKLLVDLAKQEGDDLVICAVAASTSAAGTRMASTTGAQPNAAKIKVHGDDYLKSRGIDPATLQPPTTP